MWTGKLKALRYFITFLLCFLCINELILVVTKVLHKDSFQKIDENVYDSLLSPSITLCPGPAWRLPGPFMNPEDFANSTYSWEEIFHPKTLAVLRNESQFTITETYASYYGLCFTMQKLAPEKVSDYSFQIVVNGTMDYIYYLHEPLENEYLFMSVYPHAGKVMIRIFFLKKRLVWSRALVVLYLPIWSAFLS